MKRNDRCPGRCTRSIVNGTRNDHSRIQLCLYHAKPIMARSKSNVIVSYLRQLNGLFGVAPFFCSVVWNRIGKFRPHKSKPNHLLWSPLPLKVYAIENGLSSIFGASEKTFRHWTSVFVQLLSNMKLVCEFSISYTHNSEIHRFFWVTVFTETYKKTSIPQ